MTLKRYFLVLMAALAVFACSPGTDPDDYIVDPQEQTDQTDEEDLTSVEADEAGHISADEARLYGAYSNASATPEEFGFEWGTSADALNGKVVSESVVSGRAGMFNAWLKNLSPDTEYHFRAYVKISSKTYYSSVLSFRTEPKEEGNEETDLPYMSCYEVPALNLTGAKYSGTERWGSTQWFKYDTDNADRKVVVHTYRNGKNTNGKIVRTYIILFDKTKKAPLLDCTAFNSGCWQRNSVGRNDSWQYDPALDASWQNTGVSGYSKGHLTASNDRQDNLDANHQTFYYSNQAPQYQTGFNDGVWNTLEQNIQGASPEGRDTLYVVNGLLYEDNKTSDGVPVPSHFYKCIMYCSFGTDGAMTAARGTAFIYTNERQTASYDNSKFVTTIDAMEQRTGFDFFPNVPDEFEVPAENGTNKYSI